MNFITKIFKIMTGTYNTSSNYVNNNPYFGSSNVNMTKDQLTSFNTMLENLGLSKPPGIENMIENFDSVDTDKDGKVTTSEINTYLANNGLLPKATTYQINPYLYRNVGLNNSLGSFYGYSGTSNNYSSYYDIE